MTIDKQRIKSRFVEEAEPNIGFSAGYSCFGWAFILLCFVTVVGIPVSLFLIKERSKDKAAVQSARAMITRLNRDGQPLLARVIMCNSAMSSSALPLPALALITLDEQLDNDRRMDEIAGLIASGGGDSASDKDRIIIRKLLKDIDYTPFRRRPIPATLTDENPVYAVDLLVSSNFLPPNTRISDFPALLCLATPGDAGIVIHLPYWLADSEAGEPDAKQRQQLSSYLLDMTRKTESVGTQSVTA